MRGNWVSPLKNAHHKHKKKRSGSTVGYGPSTVTYGCSFALTVGYGHRAVTYGTQFLLEMKQVDRRLRSCGRNLRLALHNCIILQFLNPHPISQRLTILERFHLLIKQPSQCYEYQTYLRTYLAKACVKTKLQLDGSNTIVNLHYKHHL